MSDGPVVKSSESVAANVVYAGTGTKRQVLTNEEEGSNFALRRFTIGAGRRIAEAYQCCRARTISSERKGACGNW